MEKQEKGRAKSHKRIKRKVRKCKEMKKYAQLLDIKGRKKRIRMQENGKIGE